MGGIGPLGAPGLDPATRFAGGQERVEAPLAGSMGHEALPKIMQPREGEAWVMQVKTQGILDVIANNHTDQKVMELPSS